jgi:hypothetical protein
MSDPSPLSPERALFVPLKGDYFDAFAEGTKTVEFRRYGPRWNERTCRVGREVVLSHGYGKARRLRGVVGWFYKQHGDNILPIQVRESLRAIYGTSDMLVACIAIELERHHG